MAEVKREMAEAERKRREEGSVGAGAGDAASAAAKLDSINVKAEQEADEKRRRTKSWQAGIRLGWSSQRGRSCSRRATPTPVRKVPTAFFGGDNSLLGAPSAGSSAQNASDPKALQSLMSMLGQDSMMSGLPSNGINVGPRGLMTGAGSGARASSTALWTRCRLRMPTRDWTSTCSTLSRPRLLDRMHSTTRTST